MIFDNSVICPVFIGREDDLRWLDRLISKSKGGNGQIALISGEAGIGKSRLIKEAKSRVSEGTIILEGHCFRTESVLPMPRSLTCIETSLPHVVYFQHNYVRLLKTARKPGSFFLTKL